MNLTRTLKAGAALFTVFSLAACGQSRNQDVVAEDIFAPAVETDDVAIDTVQTVFDDPFAAEAQLITDAGGGGELDPYRSCNSRSFSSLRNLTVASRRPPSLNS